MEAAQLVVDDLGMEGGGAAHEAVYRAAWLGLKSLHESQDSKFGGLERRVRQLEKWVCYPLKNFSLLCSQGVLPPAGVLLHGPPGTGKSTFLVNVICRRLAANPSARLLVTAPTNKAVTVLAERCVVRRIR